MSSKAIEVKNLSKVYRIGHEAQGMKGTATFRDAFTNMLKKPTELFTGHLLKKEDFWALNDINFEIDQGDVVGIIGMNGSGKSTLLKILSRIIEPTSGEIRMRGKVASLLEVGTGFHPELTGRENIFFNGAILGMKRKEIVSKFDEIVAFSEVERFLDTPVKFYSSGMYVRLAFAVAAHLDPDILIIDEVLAVGDAAFQKKSLGKMKSVAASGRTVLFVSHSMDSVTKLCDKAILLESGRVKLTGSTQSVTNQYLTGTLARASELKFTENPDKPIQFMEADIRNGEDRKVEYARLNSEWGIRLKYRVAKAFDNTIVAAEILSQNGESLFMTTSADKFNSVPPLVPGLYEAKIPFKNIQLMPGSYNIRLSIQTPGKIVFDETEALQLIVREDSRDIRGKYFDGKYMGFYSAKLEWKISSINAG